MNKTRERELNDLELQNKNAVGPNFRGIEERAKDLEIPLVDIRLL